MNKYLFVYQDKDNGKWFVDLCQNGELIDLATETEFDTEAQATVWAMEMGDKWDMEVHWDEPVKQETCLDCMGKGWIRHCDGEYDSCTCKGGYVA